MYSIAELKEKLPFETGKEYRLARERIWKKIDKGIANYIKLRQAKKFIKTTIKIPFKYDEKEQEDQITAAYDYAKNLLTPCKESDPRFAQQTVSKNEFKFFLRHMRLYYETLFAWKKIQPNEENAITIDKLKKVMERLKGWNHLYLNGWDVEKIIQEFGSDGKIALKQLIRFVFSVAGRFEYNKEGQQKQGEIEQSEDKSLKKESSYEMDKTETDQIEREDDKEPHEVKIQHKSDETVFVEIQQKSVNSISSSQALYSDKQQQEFSNQFKDNSDLHRQRIKYSYMDLFQMATERFHSQDYEQGLELINQCIEIDPKNSILFSNRALFYTELDLVEQAFTDLQYSVELNHLNYIAYFNLFSLYQRLNKQYEAFQNLSCALSCLYLLKAKRTKSEIDVTKAINYAQNNVEAHVLKGMMHLENGELKFALNQINRACKIMPQLNELKSVRSFILQKLGAQERIDNEEKVDENNGKKFTRLEGSYEIGEECDKVKLIAQKIQEFNSLYSELKTNGRKLNIYAKIQESQIETEKDSIETVQRRLELVA